MPTFEQFIQERIYLQERLTSDGGLVSADPDFLGHDASCPDNLLI